MLHFSKIISIINYRKLHFHTALERGIIMGRKITVIGAGNVGATIAYTLSLGDLASEIVLIDINQEKVEG